MKRVLVVADVSNLYFCVQKKFGGKLDYKLFLEHAVGPNQLHRAIAYGAERDNEAFYFKQALSDAGFELRYKRPLEFPTADPKRVMRKADWDVGITVDVIKILDTVDIVVFGTADGDMAEALRYVQERGREAHVLGCNISRDLKDIASRYREIDSTMLEPKRETTEQVVVRSDSTCDSVGGSCGNDNSENRTRREPDSMAEQS